MQILDEYLQAVRRSMLLVPRAQKADILRELAENLRAEMDDRESELGRPLAPAEQEGILRRHGHPHLVAARYRTSEGRVVFGRQLVGPELFPIYLAMLALTLGITGTFALIALIGKGVLAAAPFVLPMLIQSAAVTLVFTIFDYYQRSLFERWSWTPLHPQTIPRWLSVTGLVVWSALAIAWLALPRIAAAHDVTLTAAARPFHIAILLLFLAGVVQRGLNAVRPDWTRLLPVTRFVVSAAGLISLYLMRRQGPLLAGEHQLVMTFDPGRWGPFNVVGIYLGISVITYGIVSASFLRPRRAAVPLLAVLVLTLVAPLSRAGDLLSDEEIRRFLVERIDVQHKSVGMVVGIATASGHRIVAHGRAAKEDARPLDGDTIFEIGSGTKVFTALLLTDMVRRGEVALDDHVSKYLPEHAGIPSRNGRAISLADLATHTSGLPFRPDNRDVYEFLSRYELTRDPGTQWEYSNLGVGLLGEALARRAGMDYEQLVRRRITSPLRMSSTATGLSPKLRTRFAFGYDVNLKSARHWDLPPQLAGAGALRSTVKDLLTFLDAFLGRVKSPLAPAMAAMLETRLPGPPGIQQALGWWIIPLARNDEGIVSHGGQTYGYSSVMAFDPKSGAGVVVLSNSAADDGGLAWHLLRPNFPFAGKQRRAAIQLETKQLDALAGRYEVGPEVVVTIEREGSVLVMKTPHTPPNGVRLHAESGSKFFMTDADLQVEFREGGKSLVISFAGTETPAVRVPCLRNSSQRPSICE